LLKTLELLDFGRGVGLRHGDFSHDARLPIGLRVRVADGMHAMRLVETVDPKPAGGVTMEPCDGAVTCFAGEPATVQLDGGEACCLVPYSDLQLLNTEIFDCLQRALSFDSRAARVLGHSLMKGDGGLLESLFDGAFWLSRAACLGDSWCERWDVPHDCVEPQSGRSRTGEGSLGRRKRGVV
jgi:hypothetical protein